MVLAYMMAVVRRTKEERAEIAVLGKHIAQAFTQQEIAIE
jgi:hypothetical protein